jgi:hypothetical protein
MPGQIVLLRLCSGVGCVPDSDMQYTIKNSFSITVQSNSSQPHVLFSISLLHPIVQYNLTHERVIGQVAHDTFEDIKNIPSLFIFPVSMSERYTAGNTDCPFCIPKQEAEHLLVPQCRSKQVCRYAKCLDLVC